jgi:iron-regulated transporter 1
LLQRLCICLACVGWAFIISVIDNPPLQTLSKGGYDYPREVWLVKTAIMAAVIVLGMGERLAAVGNMLVMERDWACCSFHPARRRT